MNKKMTPEERYEFIKNRVRNRGRLTPIADENGNLANGLKVARLDAGEGQVILKIGTIDEICKAFGVSRPISDLAVAPIISAKMRTKVTISDKITDRLDDENVTLL